MFEQRLATRLIRIVMMFYFMVALTTTAIQVVLEFRNEKDRLYQEINNTVLMFQPVISAALWNYDQDQIENSTQSIMRTGLVHTVLIKDQSHELFFGLHQERSKTSIANAPQIINKDSIPTFKHSEYYFEFPLTHTDGDGYHGYVEVYSSSDIVVSRSLYSFVITAINALIKTLFLWGISIVILKRYLSTPLLKLTNNINRMNPKSSEHNENDKEESWDSEVLEQKNELGILIKSFIDMKNSLNDNRETLLRYQNHLEDLVADRTESISRLNEEITKASSAKSEFLANMSHEIRTPMNGIYGVVELLKHTRMDEQQTQYLGIIQSSCEALITIINDILDFSKIEAGKLTVEETDVNLEKLVYECSLVFVQRSAEKKLPLIIKLDPELPTMIKTDPVRVRQIILNLLSNAFKFTEKGQITLIITAQKENDANYIRFDVQDTGIGLSPAQLSRLFRSFEQADSSVTRKYGGTGLGLAISKQLARIMGGQIGVSSVEDFGSTFWFTIRAVDVENALAENDVHYALPPTLAAVFICNRDSDEDHVDLAIRRLGFKHYEIVSAPSPEADENYVNPVLNHNIDVTFVSGRTLEKFALHDEFKNWLTAPLIIINDPLIDDIDRWVDRRSDAFVMKPVMSPYAIRIAVSALLGPKNTSTPIQETILQSHARVLLAEDNPTNQLVAKNLLKKLGITADIANNGKEALDKALSSDVPYDLILMDWEMPMMDGLTATQKIRQHGLTRSNGKPIYIIALTAHALESQRQKALENGMDDYLVKPFTIDQLRQTLITHELIAAR